MKRFFTGIFGLALTTTASAQTLQEHVDTVREDARLVGLAAVVMRDGEVVERAASGVRVRGGDDALSPDDIFHVGSVGKSMSATAVARLVERGELGWDDTVGERMPEFAAEIDAGWHGVTLDQMLGHRAGLPQFGARDMFAGGTTEGVPGAVRRAVMKRVLAKPPKAEPGTAFEYNNTGYVLASLMAETATGHAWEDIVREEVLEPLDMDSAGFGVPTGEDVPWGHRKIGPFKTRMNPDTDPDNPPFMAAAGTLHISLEDLARYGQAHLERDMALLDNAAYARLHTPVMNDYAYGWVVWERDWADGPVIWHNGSNTMWYALLVLLPEKDAVIAVASNDGDVKRAQAAIFPMVEAVAEAWD